MPFTGSCLCGQVRYQVSGDFGSRTICHCKNCRKASGSSFLANSFFEKRLFKITHGASGIRTYVDKRTDSGATVNRSFCGNCGSPVFGENEEKLPGGIIVTTGTIDDAEGLQEWAPQVELYCKNKPAWLKIAGTEQRLEMTGVDNDEEVKTAE